MLNIETGITDTMTGLRLCKVVNEKLILCDPVQFTRGTSALKTTLNRASISGDVGPVGETGDFWADLLIENGDWIDTVKLDRKSWNILKNKWARCKIEL